MAQDNFHTPPLGAGEHRSDRGDETEAAPKKSNRGFASMDRGKQREIASKGGRAAHEKGTAHQFTSDEARQAGRKGGGTVSQDRQHMAEIGRIGGQARGRKQREASQTKTSESKPPSEGVDRSDDDANPDEATHH
jgi:general stress protein YciG